MDVGERRREMVVGVLHHPRVGGGREGSNPSPGPAVLREGGMEASSTSTTVHSPPHGSAGQVN